MNRSYIRKSQDLKLSIFDSVHLLSEAHWKSIVPENEVYMTLPYLRALEASLGDKVDFRYIMFYNDAFKPVGIAIVQLLQFTSKELNTTDLHERFGNYVPEKLLDNLQARVMLCGNAFSTGENGFMFSKTVSNDVAKRNLSRALNRVKRDEKKANNGVSIILLKDFWPEQFDQLEVLKQEGYSAFEIDVNMVVKIKPNWKTFDDYLFDLTTKYRTKVKGIYKKSDGLTVSLLTPQIIRQYSQKIEILYHNVLKRADYRFGELNAETFALFTESMPNYFQMVGYFLEDKLVGFSTCFKGDEVVDANFVGIDYEHNHEHAIYQRILCDFIRYAIDSNMNELRLGRTAEEIKSTLGAEPIDMRLFVKHKNHITNKLVKPVVGQIRPSKFEFRRPFKAVLYQD